MNGLTARCLGVTRFIGEFKAVSMTAVHMELHGGIV